MAIIGNIPYFQTNPFGRKKLGIDFFFGEWWVHHQRDYFDHLWRCFWELIWWVRSRFFQRTRPKTRSTGQSLRWSLLAHDQLRLSHGPKQMFQLLCFSWVISLTSDQEKRITMVNYSHQLMATSWKRDMFSWGLCVFPGTQPFSDTRSSPRTISSPAKLAKRHPDMAAIIINGCIFWVTQLEMWIRNHMVGKTVVERETVW